MEELRQFVNQMQSTSSSLDKVEILKKQSDFIKKVLEYTYNPYKQFNVTSKTCKKNRDLCDHVNNIHDNIFDLLDDLTNRKYTGHGAIASVNGFVAQNPGHKDLIYNIIDKDLEIRAGAKVLNKAVPGLIPTFEVALAQSYEGKCDWNDTWYASRKLDGVRCLAVVNTEGKCTLYSRMGKEFTTLNKVKEAIEATNIINTVFDGEICLVDENGDEDFQSVMKQLRRKDHQIENPKYMMFDMLHKPDFENEKSTEILSDRLHTLRSFCESNQYNEFGYLAQAVVTGDEHFDTWTQMATDNNWEGVMLRKDVGYEGKRSKNLLKVKKFFDAEYTVVDCDVSPMSVVRDGKEAQETMLAQVYIEHKGYKVKVGSGFSQEQRIKYTTEDIVGKIITVQYFEETKNDKGGISLRFPTVKHIYENERDC
jgi:DNA ligase 1